MAEKLINFDLDDPRAGKIAEALSNKTCKRILGLLAEKEMNASELAEEMKSPLNTIGYNLEKLVDTGLVEKSEGIWSVKGRRIEKYKIADKKIVISPKSMFKGILPAVLVSGIVALGIKMFYGTFNVANKAGIEGEVFAGGKDMAEVVAEATPMVAEKGVNVINSASSVSAVGDVWLWFLLGAMFGLLVMVLWNWRKMR